LLLQGLALPLLWLLSSWQCSWGLLALMLLLQGLTLPLVALAVIKLAVQLGLACFDAESQSVG
jgi:hypothetical protein